MTGRKVRVKETGMVYLVADEVGSMLTLEPLKRCIRGMVLRVRRDKVDYA